MSKRIVSADEFFARLAALDDKQIDAAIAALSYIRENRQHLETMAKLAQDGGIFDKLWRVLTERQ